MNSKTIAVHTLALVCGALWLGCGSDPKPAKLASVDKLMSDARVRADISKAAPKILAEAEAMHLKATEAYDDGDMEDADELAELAEVIYLTGVERAKSAAASARIGQAEDRKEEASGEIEEQKARLAKLKPHVQRMEKLLKLGKNEEQLKAELDKQRREEEERLSNERKQAEVQNKLALVAGKMDTAVALNASKYDKANVASAQRQLTQARKLGAKSPDKALALLSEADTAISSALEKARKAFAEENAKLDMLKEQKEILAKANQIGMGAEAVQTPNSIVITLRQLFKAGKTVVLDSRKELVRQVSELAKAYPKYPVLVNGYTDSRGPAHRNLSLSTARAQSVQSFMVESGVTPARLKAAGYGEGKPISDNSSRDGRAKNRRVEVVFLFP